MDKVEAVALKPCPFCGGKSTGVYFNLENDPHYRVVCTNKDCGAQGPRGEIMTGEDSEKWNARHEIDALQAEVERLRAEVAEYASTVQGYIDTIAEADAQAERLAEALREKADKWDRIGDEHGVRQFTGNDHKLFANELRALLRDQEGQ